MSAAETTLKATLSAAAGVTAIVGDRIYPDVVPQEVALPCIAFARAETEYTTTLDGAVAAARATIEISCMALARSNADALAAAVQAAVVAAHFVMTGRRVEFDTEHSIWSTVLTVDFWE